MAGRGSQWVRLVLVCACAAAAAGGPPPFDEEMAELAAMLRESCAGESGVDLALIEQVNAGADLMADAALKCYIKCVMETAGMMSGGAVDVEATVAMLPDGLRAKNEPGLRACGAPRGADDCDSAFLAQQCWQKANKADYYLI